MPAERVPNHSMPVQSGYVKHSVEQFMEQADWINLSEAAELLGVHPTTVRAWADKGKIESRRTSGGHRRFNREHLLAWSSARVKHKNKGAEVVIQNMLGRVRMELTSGRLSAEAWYQMLDKPARQLHAEFGRQLLTLLNRYLASDRRGRKALRSDIRTCGEAYEQVGRSNGLSLAQIGEAYLFFRSYLLQTLYDMATAAGMQGPTDWEELHERIDRFTNTLLLDIIRAYEKHSTNPSSDLPH